MKKKSTAYLLWFFFGLLGVHNFYLKEIKTGILKIVLLIGMFSCIIIFIGTSSTLSTLIFALIAITSFVLWLIDLFKTNKKVKRLNSVLETMNRPTEDRQHNYDAYDYDNEENYYEKGIEEEFSPIAKEAPETKTVKRNSAFSEEIKKTGKNIGANLGATALTTALGPLRLVTDPLLKAATGKNTQETIGGKLGATATKSSPEDFIEKKRRRVVSHYRGL